MENLLKIFRIYTILILTTRQHYLVQCVFVDVHEQYILSGSCCAMYTSLQFFLKVKAVPLVFKMRKSLLALVRLFVSINNWHVLLQPSSSQCLPTWYKQKSSIRWIECRKNSAMFLNWRPTKARTKNHQPN